LTPVEVPLIVVVTGEEGRQYGYEDRWEDDGAFHYFGAGQAGDMTFIRGNKALRDHAETGEDVHLFEQVWRGLSYVGPVTCVGHYVRENALDRDGNPRRAIVFELVLIDEVTDRPPMSGSTASSTGSSPRRDRRWRMPLDELRTAASRTLGRTSVASEAKRRSYERSEDLKVYVRRRASGTCEGCESPAPFVTRQGHPYLEPHHTRRVSDGGPDDYHHVIALCPTCHRRVHQAADGESYNTELQVKLASLEP
jgi:5-methylcytosine-specific restriction protein A